MSEKLPAKRIEELRSSYAEFALAVHPEWGKTFFQAHILAPMLERVALGDPEWRRVITTLPFRYSKTEFCVDTFIPFYLGHNPNHRVIIVSYGAELSKASGRAIKELMQSDIYAQIFPDSVVSRHSKSAKEFSTVSDGKFYAGSFATGINGRGAHLLIIDDPHKNLEDITSETKLEKTRKVYTWAVATRCEPNATVMIDSVRWTPADFIGWRLEQDGGWDVVRQQTYTDNEDVVVSLEKKPVWKVIRLQHEAQVDEGWRKPECACGIKDEDGNVIPHGEPLWPERWTCKHNVALMNDPELRESSYLLKPTVAGGYLLAKTPPQFYEKINPQGMNVYMICDPSMGRQKKSDRTAIGVIGVGEDRNFYLLDLVWGQMDLVERMDNIFRLHRKWRPIVTGYEEYGAVSDSSSLKDRMERENYRFIVTELGRAGEWHNLSKGRRIAHLLPLATAGRIWLPNPKSIHVSPELAAKVQRFIDKEWNKYPGAMFDDVLDMLSRIADPGLNVRFPSFKQYIPHRPRAAGRSWMSA